MILSVAIPPSTSSLPKSICRNIGRLGVNYSVYECKIKLVSLFVKLKTVGFKPIQIFNKVDLCLFFPYKNLFRLESELIEEDSFSTIFYESLASLFPIFTVSRHAFMLRA